MEFNFAKELRHLIGDLKHTDMQKVNELRFDEINNDRMGNIIEMGNTLVLAELDKQNDLNAENFAYIKNALVYTLALSLIVSPKMKNNYHKLLGKLYLRPFLVEKCQIFYLQYYLMLLLGKILQKK